MEKCPRDGTKSTPGIGSGDSVGGAARTAFMEAFEDADESQVGRRDQPDAMVVIPS